MKIAVSELIVRFMERLSIAHIFGMPGAHILPVYDRLYDSKIETILVKHEQGAAFMACGYARASGGISACIATAGPGATNMVTGIANAYADKLPILVITGETATYIFGKGGLQESSGEGGTLDQAALFRDITRYHRVIERTDYLGQVLRQAANILLSRHSGPVLLSLPYNVQNELVDEDILDDINFSAAGRAPCSCPAPVQELAQAILAASYPVIVAGHGCLTSGAGEAVGELSEMMGIPIATSLKGKGVIGEGDGLSLGCLGVTSDGRAYRYIVEACDLVIFLGAGFNERTSYLWDAQLLGGRKLVQVDHDAEQLEKVFKADVSIHGDIHDVVAATLTALKDRGAPRKALDRFSSHSALGKGSSQPGFPVIEHFFSRLTARFPENALIVDDNMVFAQSFLKVSPGNRYFPNSGISSLGHAIPAALGARLAVAGPTFAILGDGGFQMCCMELMTAVNHGVPLNAVVLNNSTMGLIRKNQFQLYKQRYIGCDFVNPDYGLLARSFGIRHYRIESAADVDALFADADLVHALNLIEIMLDKNDFPSYLSGR
ncbi:MAG: thiamine pyrophosphate-binding protein [Rhodocyclaceae bacterium]|nr:thiamine pyrophosphate-binding protein [Rhodocyclaceae bacterium]